MSAEIDENTTVEDVAIEEMKFTKGPSKKDIEDIEKEFHDILENDETSADNSRFTEQEMQQIDTIWKYIQRQAIFGEDFCPSKAGAMLIRERQKLG